MDWTEQRLGEILERQEAWLLALPGVGGVGVALGRKDQLCLEILTHGIDPPTRRRITGRLAGVPVQFTETGPITPLPELP